MIRRLNLAFKKYDERIRSGVKVGKPRFKPYHRMRSFDVDYNYAKNKSMIRRKSKRWEINIKGFGPIYVKELPCKRQQITTIRIVKTPVRINVQFVYWEEKTSHVDRTPILGVSVGIKSRAHCSNGRTIRKVKINRDKQLHHQRKLRLHRKRDCNGKVKSHHKPKTKGSYSWRVAQRSLAKESFRIAERERHKLHRQSHVIVQSNPNIAMKNIQIGKVTSKGKHNKKLRARLNKCILEQQWGRLLHFLTYKAERAGGQVVTVDPWDTSKTCSECGSVKGNLRLSERVYTCSGCGIKINRDLNAAINVALRGKELLRDSGLNVQVTSPGVFGEVEDHQGTLAIK